MSDTDLEEGDLGPIPIDAAKLAERCAAVEAAYRRHVAAADEHQKADFELGEASIRLSDSHIEVTPTIILSPMEGSLIASWLKDSTYRNARGLVFGIVKRALEALRDKLPDCLARKRDLWLSPMLCEQLQHTKEDLQKDEETRARSLLLDVLYTGRQGVPRSDASLLSLASYAHDEIQQLRTQVKDLDEAIRAQLAAGDPE